MVTYFLTAWGRGCRVIEPARSALGPGYDNPCVTMMNEPLCCARRCASSGQGGRTAILE